MDLLTIKNLSIAYGIGKERVEVLKQINLQIKAGEIVGLAGESGSGKSTLGKAIVGLLPKDASIYEGTISYEDCVLTDMRPREWHKKRGKDIVLVSGGQGDVLNPTRKIKKQFFDIVGKNNLSKTCIEEMLESMSIQEPREVMEKYPFELSGGMKQRIVLGMALLQQPRLLIVDEPTSAIDQCLKYEMLEVLKKAHKEYGLTILVISHHLKELYTLCHRIGIMYQGKLIEVEETGKIFQEPNHPYTKLLLGRRGIEESEHAIRGKTSEKEFCI